MPSKTGTSSLSERLAAQGVHEIHHEAMAKEIPDVSGFQRLPAGIEGGVARLAEIKFGQYTESAGDDLKGKDFVQLTGVMIEPEEHDGKRVKNLRTSPTVRGTFTIPLCTTHTKDKKEVPFQTHWDDFMIELRKLAPDAEIDPDTIEEFCASLTDPESPPLYFGVRTWKSDDATLENRNGKFFIAAGRKTYGPFLTENEAKTRHPWAFKPGRVSEVWTGVIRDYVEPEVNGVADETATEESAAEQAPAERPTATARTATRQAVPSRNGPARNANPPATTVATTAPAATPARTGPARSAQARKQAPAPTPVPEPAVEEPVFNEFDELDSLAAVADDKTDPDRKAAMASLREAADKAGILEKEVDDAADWAAVVALIRSATGGGEAGEESATEPQEELKVGSVRQFYPLNPATRKPSKEPMAVKVTVIKGDTATVQSLDNPSQKFSNVKLTELLSDE